MHNFKELQVWKRSMRLVSGVYVLTHDMPDTEKFGLALQMRRAAVSIPSNIAEGCGRDTPKYMKQYLRIAIGSSFELETQLLISESIDALSAADIEPIVIELREIQKMLIVFARKFEE